MDPDKVMGGAMMRRDGDQHVEKEELESISYFFDIGREESLGWQIPPGVMLE